MPNQDGTGPQGKGPKTGRQMGKCQDAKPLQIGRCGRPRGQGNGQNRGQGLGRRFQD
jgi:hypothetical protein